MSIVLRACSLLFACALLCACSTAHRIQWHFQSSETLNLNNHYQSLPVVVKIFQLSGRQAFMQSSFYQLWKSPKVSLGSSLLDEQQVIINPGDHQRVNVFRHPKARYVAAIALFRKPSANHWRVIQALGPSVPYVPNHMSVNLADNRLYVMG